MPIKRSHIYQLKVTLLDVRPRVWRRLLVSSEFTLGELHHIIQIAMGWTDSHLHLFKSDKGALYGDLTSDEDGMLSFKDEWATDIRKVLPKPKKKLLYEYDFGDGWEHEILLEKQFPQVGNQAFIPECLAAVGACPPEDVGGVPGYQEFVAAMKDPNHPDHAQVVDWYGEPDFDPNEADIDAINECLKNPASALPADAAEDSLPGWPDALGAQLDAHIAQREFETEEELREIINAFLAQKSRQTTTEFEGLTFEQMHKLLYETFVAADVLEWKFDAVTLAKAPVLRMVTPLLTHLSESKLKLTAKGNLSLAIVREMASAGEDVCAEDTSFAIRSEEDVSPVHVTRILAEIGGLTKPSRTTLSLSGEGRRLFDSKDWPSIYQRLIKAAFLEFNGQYLGGPDELPSLQVGGPFSLRLLNKFGREWRDSFFYAERMAAAFPTIRNELSPCDYLSTDTLLNIEVSARLLTLLDWFGLIERREIPPPPESKTSLPTMQVRATTLFYDLIDWKV